MPENVRVLPRVFTAIQNVDIKELSLCTHKEIRPILPCLVRMSLISPLDITKECVEGRKQVLTILSGIESVNSIIALLSIDFHALETDVRQEQQIRLEFALSILVYVYIGCITCIKDNLKFLLNHTIVIYNYIDFIHLKCFLQTETWQWTKGQYIGTVSAEWIGSGI